MTAIYQITAASFDDATHRMELDQLLLANRVYATLEAAQAALQEDSDSDRRAFDDPDLVPAPLDWALTSTEEATWKTWEATDEELGMIFRVTECQLG